MNTTSTVREEEGEGGKRQKGRPKAARPNQPCAKPSKTTRNRNEASTRASEQTRKEVRCPTKRGLMHTFAAPGKMGVGGKGERGHHPPWQPDQGNLLH